MNRLLSEIASKLESGSRPKGGVTKEGEIPSLGAEHLDKEGGFDFSNIKKVSYNFYNALSSGKIENNDILIVKDGATTGKVSFVGRDFPFDTATINEHVFRIQIQIDIAYPKYVFHFLRSNEGNRQVMSDFHGATVGGISRKFMGKVKIPLPHLESQKKIAAILDKADELRQNDKKILEKYDQLAHSVFLNMFGDLQINPKGWPKIRLGDLGKLTSGSTPSRERPEYYNGEIPWIKTGEVKGTLIVETEEKITKSALSNSNCKLYPKGSIVIAMYGQGITRGKVGILGIEATTNQACAVIPPSKLMDYNFLFSYLKMSYEILREMGRGGNQPNLNVGMLKEFEVFSPPIGLQVGFSGIISKIETQIQLTRQSFQKSEELFQSLLQGAFRGELD